MRVCHLTSVHPAYDVRIFLKECRSLVQAGYDVVLVAPHAHDEVRDGVSLRAVPQPTGRAVRMTKTVLHVFREAQRAGADVYHLHDPELLPVGLLLGMQGNRVVYDVHEDVPLQVQTKYWLPKVMRRPLAAATAVLEICLARSCAGIVAATPAIARKFPSEKTVVVRNYPLRSEFSGWGGRPYGSRPNQVAYIGELRHERGIREMMRATEHLADRLDVRLVLGGRFSPSSLEREVSQESSWEYVDYLGWLSRAEVGDVLGNARVGLVTLHPSPNIIESQPVKLFEYMAAGLPVVASDFPVWRGIIEGARCGILVDPLEPVAIAEAIQWLLEHPREAEEMGRRGRDEVSQTYSWEVEAQKLHSLYGKILSPGDSPCRHRAVGQ